MPAICWGETVLKMAMRNKSALLGGKSIWLFLLQVWSGPVAIYIQCLKHNCGIQIFKNPLSHRASFNGNLGKLQVRKWINYTKAMNELRRCEMAEGGRFNCLPSLFSAWLLLFFSDEKLGLTTEKVCRAQEKPAWQIFCLSAKWK